MTAPGSPTPGDADRGSPRRGRRERPPRPVGGESSPDSAPLGTRDDPEACGADVEKEPGRRRRPASRPRGNPPSARPIRLTIDSLTQMPIRDAGCWDLPYAVFHAAETHI